LKQNLAEKGVSVAQRGHNKANLAPQLKQNFASFGFNVSHSGQFIGRMVFP